MAGPTHSAPRVAIIGAGIAGLNAAHQLKKAGVTATVYEATARAGGRMLSTTMQDGLTVDIGAELINTDHADMLDLVKEFNIELFDKLRDVKHLPYPKEAYFFAGVSYSETQLINDLRPIAAQISRDAKLLDRDWDSYAPLFDQRSVADYLDSHADKLTAPYVRALLENAIRTEFGAEPAESSALQLLFILPEVKGQAVELLSYSDEVYAVVGGSAQITNAMAAALPGQIRYNKILRAIEEQGPGYRLKFADKTEQAADIVIIAAPFPALRNVTLKVPLPTLFRRFIAEAGLGDNEKLIAGFSERFWRTPAGFSLAAWSDLGFAEAWDETQRQPLRPDGALNFFLGGDQARQLNKINAFKPRGESFIAALDAFVPGAVNAKTGDMRKSAWGKNPYSQGAYASYKPGQLTEFGEYFWIEGGKRDSRQVGFDRLIFAGEHLSDAYYGFMEGGAQTGRLAAELALQKMTVLA
ncbi:FAD-dependent oxidoreductase [Methylomonas sp. SURF-2]|uniref:FAD-dependent oxidoreductase n=2 Tax=Methylomonas subterranea TaxID=2952225 RepID=A0ABT1TLR1_9GAMM|nr:FAD-dependent oxidoreductase [Methylomonas sp. SURF-2]